MSLDKLLKIAENEIGYLEKKSNSQLDNKTANAGSNNWTNMDKILLKKSDHHMQTELLGVMCS